MSADDRPLDVALVITALHGVSGGAERVLVDVANGLHRRGHRVTALTYQQHNGPSFYPLDYGIRRLDGRQRSGSRPGSGLASLSSTARRSPLVGLAVWLVRYGPKTLRLRRLLRLARPDVAVGFLPSSFPYLALAATGTGVPIVSSIHNVPWRELGGDPERWDQNPIDIRLRRWALRRSAATTVLLPSFVDQLEPDVRVRAEVIPNPIAPYDGARAELDDDPVDNVISAVGRLYPQKDHETLLRAWALIEREHPSWRLRIIGDGPLHRELDDLVDELRLERAVLEPPRSDITSIYVSSKFLVLPSRYEGFGLVTLEAMACGLPVIGFADCDGTNELVVDGENGLLVDPGDDRVGALADAMRRLIIDEDERVRLGAAAPATAAGYSPDAVVDQWESLLRRVASERRPRWS